MVLADVNFFPLLTKRRDQVRVQALRQAFRSQDTSASEFQNTFDHEKGHLAMHIANALNIDLLGEEFQYLTGEIGQKMFLVARRFLCDHCRVQLDNASF